MRDVCLKKDKKGDSTKCRQDSASDKAVNGSDRVFTSDDEQKTKTGASTDTGVKFSQAAKTEHQTSSELSSERMWEDISDASETSDFSSSYSNDLSPQPATTTVTIVGNGLIQVAPADPLIRRFSLESGESKTLMRSGLKTGDDRMWSCCDDEWDHSVEDDEISPTDAGHPHRLVQLQNILPLFIFGKNSDGSRSVEFAVIGDRKLTSDYLLLPRTAAVSRTLSTTADEADSLQRNNTLPPLTTVSKLVQKNFVIRPYTY